MTSLERQRSTELEELRSQLVGIGITSNGSNPDFCNPMERASSGGSNGSTGGDIPSMGVRRGGLGESKMQYIRSMVHQYLSCKDPVVRPHIESALIAIFRFNDQEREAIESRQREDELDTISSITSFLGSLTTSA